MWYNQKYVQDIRKSRNSQQRVERIMQMWQSTENFDLYNINEQSITSQFDRFGTCMQTVEYDSPGCSLDVLNFLQRWWGS